MAAGLPTVRYVDAASSHLQRQPTSLQAHGCCWQGVTLMFHDLVATVYCFHWWLDCMLYTCRHDVLLEHFHSCISPLQCWHDHPPGPSSVTPPAPCDTLYRCTIQQHRHSEFSSNPQIRCTLSLLLVAKHVACSHTVVMSIAICLLCIDILRCWWIDAGSRTQQQL